MSLTPQWQKIRRSDASIHAALQWLAAAIYEGTEESVPLSQAIEIDLSAALKHGLIASDNGKIAFSDSDIRYDYIVRHAVDLALSAWDDLETFASVLAEIYRCSFRFHVRREIGTGVLLVLNYEHEKDIIGRIAELAIKESTKEKRDGVFYKLYDLFCRALPALDPEPASLASALEPILKATPGGYQIYSAIEELASRSQNNADALYQGFIAHLESPVVELAFNALLGLAKFDLPEAHHRALVLTESEVSTHRRIGIFALGQFKYDNGDQHDLLCSTLERLEAPRTVPDVETDSLLVRAYGNLLDQSDKAIEAFVELASSQDPAVRLQIANVLFHKAERDHCCPWYKESLFRLIRVPLPSLDTLKPLDSVIRHYAKNEPDTALKILENLAIGWNYSRSGEENRLPDVLTSTFMELYNSHRDAFMVEVTRWWASDRQRLHLAAWHVQLHLSSTLAAEADGKTEVVFRNRAEKSSALTLSKQVLDGLDEQSVTHVLYRIAGYLADGRSLAALLLSALAREPYSPNICDLVIKLLSDYVLYNYPYEAGEYLKHRTTSDSVTETERQVIQDALRRSDAYFKARHHLPRLKELQPPSHRLYLLQLAQ